MKLTCLGRGSSDFYEIWHTGVLITTCHGIDIALEEGFDQAGKAGFGVLHASQLVGHAARLLYFVLLRRQRRCSFNRIMTDVLLGLINVIYLQVISSVEKT